MVGPPLNNKALVKEITRRLGVRGIEVSVQPAITTSSYYLTFDYGVLKKARVGDHQGKGYKYSYEIGAHYPSCQVVPSQYQGRTYYRRLYPATHVGQLVLDVLSAKSLLVGKYGEAGYDKIVARNKASLP